MNSFEIEFQYSKNDILKFAELSGDFNPIHIDEDYGKKSVFQANILHGFLGASKISKVLGVDFPGPGTIYLKQNLCFKAPMFPEVKYKVVINLMEENPERKNLLFETKIIDKISGETCIIDEALVMNESWFQK